MPIPSSWAQIQAGKTQLVILILMEPKGVRIRTKWSFPFFTCCYTGFLGLIQQSQYTIGNITFYAPSAQLANSRSDLMANLKKAKEQFNAELQSGTKSGDIPFPTSGINCLILCQSY